MLRVWLDEYTAVPIYIIHFLVYITKVVIIFFGNDYEGGKHMLKVVGTDHGKVVDEKVLIDDSNKITKYGIILIGLDLLADIGILFLLSKAVKRYRGRK
ncbi:hypothetical protein D7V86_12745 [bacterium D16-51]|nr:hypothetical protein D7V96_06190 [bacterium D16-59]RKI59369.1 hypothetical protein D7V86_12745 [bacterium D16-51]